MKFYTDQTIKNLLSLFFTTSLIAYVHLKAAQDPDVPQTFDKKVHIYLKTKDGNESPCQYVTIKGLNKSDLVINFVTRVLNQTFIRDKNGKTNISNNIIRVDMDPASYQDPMLTIRKRYKNGQKSGDMKLSTMRKSQLQDIIPQYEQDVELEIVYNIPTINEKLHFNIVPIFIDFFYDSNQERAVVKDKKEIYQHPTLFIQESVYPSDLLDAINKNVMCQELFLQKGNLKAAHIMDSGTNISWGKERKNGDDGSKFYLENSGKNFKKYDFTASKASQYVHYSLGLAVIMVATGHST